MKSFRVPVIFLFSLFLGLQNTYAQTCPPNIDFENGTFDGWTCYTGRVAASGGDNIITLAQSGPVYERHTMYSNGDVSRDPYGNFPVLCPNGSGHSIRLGNNTGGGQAEGVSYEFTIPQDQDNYSFIYHYAVVFQQPNHRPNEQPRMEIEITNLTDGRKVDCASFTFIAIGSSLPGFQVSNIDTIPVLYKDWTTVSVDLSGNAGKRIKLFFKTGDCTFIRHFGYAYIDVDSECGNSILGSVYCPDDTAVNVTAPFGYASYTWYDSSLTSVLGNSQVLTLSPPPTSGTVLAVKLEPYSGFGCPTILYANMYDTLKVRGNAGPDVMSCNKTPVQIGVPPRTGLRYSWTPIDGLSNPSISNPIASPSANTNYIVKTTSSGGGCITYDTVYVKSSIIDTSLQVIGKPAFCAGHGDSAVLKVQPTFSIQWFRNNAPLSGAVQSSYKVNTVGSYHAFLTNADGCKISTRKQQIIIDTDKPGIRYPEQYALLDIPLDLSARKIGVAALWKPSLYLNDPVSFTPVFRSAKEQQYTIDITSGGGCLTVDTQLVKIVKAVEIFVPTAFTPNSDGVNDVLRPTLRGVRTLRYFRVYNRWGELLYQKNTAADPGGWNGKYKGMDMTSQAVVWVVECVGLDNKVYEKRGSSLVVR